MRAVVILLVIVGLFGCSSAQEDDRETLVSTHSYELSPVVFESVSDAEKESYVGERKIALDAEKYSKELSNIGKPIVSGSSFMITGAEMRYGVVYYSLSNDDVIHNSELDNIKWIEKLISNDSVDRVIVASKLVDREYNEIQDITTFESKEGDLDSFSMAVKITPWSRSVVAHFSSDGMVSKVRIEADGKLYEQDIDRKKQTVFYSIFGRHVISRFTPDDEFLNILRNASSNVSVGAIGWDIERDLFSDEQLKSNQALIVIYNSLKK